MAKTPIGKWYKSLPKWSARLLLAMIAMATLIIVVDLALMTTFALQASGISLQRTPTSVAPTSVAPTSVVPTSTAPTTTPTTALWTPTAEPTASPTEVVSPTATMIPTATVEPTASATPTSEPTATTSPTTEPTATATDVVQPTATATAEPTPTQVVWPTATSTPVIVEWRGEYFDNGTLIGLPTVVRNDQAVNFDWGFNGPAAGLPADGFSARWTRVLGFTEGLYRFHARMDDGLRLYVDGQLILDEWRAGGARELTVDRRLSAGNHSVRVEYYEQSGTATVLVWWEKVNAPSYPDWKGEYWSNRTLNGDPALVRNDGANVSGGGFQFDWGQGSPSSAIPSDHFSARWTRQVDLDKGTYRFHALVDDGVRLWVDGQLIVDAWSDHDGREFTSDYALVKGTHQFRVEYYERVGNARIRVWWEKISAPSYPDWKGEYWNNRELRGDPALVRNDSAIDFDWREGSASPGLPIDDFSARWTRQLWFEQGTYRFHALVDDGVRLWLDGQLLIDAWYDHGTHELTVDIAVARGTHDVKVEYYDRLRQAQIGVWWDRVASPSYPDWKAEYWDNRDLTGNPVLVRNDRELDFNWGKGAAAAGLPVDNWSARWSRKVTFQSGVYRFYAWADDGIRITIDGRRVIDEWHGATNEVYEIDGALSGERQLTVEFSEHSGDARVRFWWKRLGDIPTPTPTATTQPTATATATATTQPTPTATATTEPTPTATATTEPTPTATATSEPTPTATATTEPTPTATATPEPTPTPTVTTQPTPTATATTEPTPEQASVRINELLTVPGKTDWDGDGSVGENDEWIELHNGSTALVDLSGWTLEASDKVPPGLAKGKAKGEAKAQDLSDTYQFPAETVLEPGKFLVLFRGQTGLALRDKGGDLRLLDAQGDLVDSVTFEKLPPDVSYSRSEEGPWLVSHQPSPGATNVLPSVRPAR